MVFDYRELLTNSDAQVRRRSEHDNSKTIDGTYRLYGKNGNPDITVRYNVPVTSYKNGYLKIHLGKGGKFARTLEAAFVNFLIANSIDFLINSRIVRREEVRGIFVSYAISGVSLSYVFYGDLAPIGQFFMTKARATQCPVTKVAFHNRFKTAKQQYEHLSPHIRSRVQHDTY
jgi:hypothetical protein